MTCHSYAGKVFLTCLRTFKRYIPRFKRFTIFNSEERGIIPRPSKLEYCKFNETRDKTRTKEGRGVEPLHHIRVTTRKLRNAFRIFKDVFPQKRVIQWKNSLRQLGQVSSAARDLDIQIIFLGSFKRNPISKKFLQVISLLQERLKVRRQRLQPQIVRSLNRLEKSQTLDQLEIFLKKISLSSEENAAEDIRNLAQKRIAKRLKKIFAYQVYVDRPECSEQLHQLRIAVKHLRYTLENFELLYGQKISAHIESVRSVQSVLGKLHDYDVWIATLPKYYKKGKGHEGWNEVIEDLLAECRRSRGLTYREFHELWYHLKQKYFWQDLRKILRLNVSTQFIDHAGNGD